MTTFASEVNPEAFYWFSSVAVRAQTIEYAWILINWALDVKPISFSQIQHCILVPRPFPVFNYDLTRRGPVDWNSSRRTVDWQNNWTLDAYSFTWGLNWLTRPKIRNTKTLGVKRKSMRHFMRHFMGMRHFMRHLMRHLVKDQLSFIFNRSSAENP